MPGAGEAVQTLVGAGEEGGHIALIETTRVRAIVALVAAVLAAAFLTAFRRGWSDLARCSRGCAGAFWLSRGGAARSCFTGCSSCLTISASISAGAATFAGLSPGGARREVRCADGHHRDCHHVGHARHGGHGHGHGRALTIAHLRRFHRRSCRGRTTSIDFLMQFSRWP